MLKTFIIAEAGVNHNGKIKLAYDLIDAACNAGSDAVKFQTWKTEKLLTDYAQKAEYQKKATLRSESQFDMIKKLELSYDDFRELKNYCDKKKIMFISSASDKESIDFLISIGISKIKTSSADLTNYPFLKYIARFNKDTIISTGMANIKEVGEAIDILLKNGLPKEKITILHCNSEYPTPFSDVNLNAMQTIRNKFCVKVGYSDHTEGIEVSAAAVALGAEVIEKHFTLDKNMKGPDHNASLDPGELKKMVFSIRNIEKSLGKYEKVVSESEKKNISIVRKSIISACNIKKGDIFSADNLTVKRPGTGISPMNWEKVIGQIAKRNFKKDEQVEL